MKNKALVSFVKVLLLSVGAVVCCMNGDVQLTGSESNARGRVEFCHDGEWGIVCDDDWDEKDARVVCRQLGLPSKVVSALIGFGGGPDREFIDSTGCNGSESRLDECPNSGIENVHCLNDRYAGVLCSSDEDIVCDIKHPAELQNPPECQTMSNDISPLLPSAACLHRYGNCVPFYPDSSPTPCDDLYKPGIDYIFVPHNRSKGNLERLVDDMAKFGHLLLDALSECYEPARRLLCHYYLPPCGNTTNYQPPSAVCPEQCRAVTQLCPEEWAGVQEQFGQSNAIIISEGLQLINCDFPGSHLSPLSHCCTDLNLNFSTEVDDEDEAEEDGFILSPVYIGSGAGALAIMILIVSASISCVLCKLYCKPKKREMVISSPQTYHGRSNLKTTNSVEIIVDDAPPVTNRYTQNGEMMHTLKRREGSRVSRVLSGFIRQMSEDKLLIPEESINLISIVGQGEFGVVYRATLTNWKQYFHHSVAVKTLKGVFSSSDMKQLVEESQIMSKFDHRHVMKLLGVSINKERTLYVVMPFMAQGSLLSYLRRNRADLTVERNYNNTTDLIGDIGSKLLSMCLQIAKGMEYLASQKFLHRDLAARNCMDSLSTKDIAFSYYLFGNRMDLYNVIKVADFGLSEDVYSRNYFRQMAVEMEDSEAPVKLPVRWMALESLNDGVFTEKTDVWSFGVTCWEVFSLGKNPYPGVDPFSLIRYLERGDRLDRPLNAACSQEIYDMMMDCWNKCPEDRPTFSELVALISITLEGMAGYIDFTPSNSLCNELNSDPEIDTSDPEIETSI